MLETPRTFREAVAVGPIAPPGRPASHTFITDPKTTGVVAVALAEEMPVNETVELEGRLGDEMGMAIDQVVVNALLPERFSGDECEQIAAANGSHPVTGRAGRAARGAVRARARPRRSARSCGGSSASLDAPVATLPYLFEARPRPRLVRAPVGRAGAAAGVSVARLIEGKRIVVCAGPGGVGKTTTAAAVALGMAEQGLKVAVLTIDPAKRLANSLGLEELGNEADADVPIEFDSAAASCGR